MTSADFKNIYNKHVRLIRNYVYYRSGNTDVADEITQETFIKFWEKQFKHDDEHTKALLYKMANQLFLDYIRKNKVKDEYTEQLKFDLKYGVEQTVDNEAVRAKCERALINLSDKERIVFLMSRKDQMTYTDIADCLEISVKAVEKRMSQAMKKLRVNAS